MTPTQSRTAAKLTDEWQCAYSLKESLSTLRALVRLGVAESRSGPGAIFSPRTAIEFRKRKGSH